jgi:hypothetical protein
MENLYENKINEINNLLNSYYEKERNRQFSNSEENYNKNLKIKIKIKELIINANDNTIISEKEKQILKNKLLKLLAENTGCVEDCKIAEHILKELVKENIINQNNVDYYYSNENTGRWK